MYIASGVYISWAFWGLQLSLNIEKVVEKVLNKSPYYILRRRSIIVKHKLSVHTFVCQLPSE